MKEEENDLLRTALVQTWSLVYLLADLVSITSVLLLLLLFLV